MFKKITASLLAITMVFGAGAQLTGGVLPDTAVSASAETMTYGDFEYQFGEHGGIEITKYKGEGGEVVFPSEIDGIGVGMISRTVFDRNDTVTSVYIPEYVHSIGGANTTDFDPRYAYLESGANIFYTCSNLESITVDPANDDFYSVDGVLYWDDVLLAFPPHKAELNIPENVTALAMSSLSRLTMIEDITIPDTVTDLGKCAFDGSQSLKIVHLSENIRRIGDGTFENCTNLETVELPDGIYQISFGAFWNCESLKNINFPESLAEIGSMAFRNCSSLEEISLGENLEEIADIAFAGCTSLKSVTVPDSVKKIQDKAFGYYFSEESQNYEKMNGFTLRCGVDSVANTYARNNGFTLVKEEDGMREYTTGPVLKKGDIDGDGLVDAGDIVKIAAHVKGISRLSDEEAARSDFNGDGKIDIDDILLLAAHIKGISKLS